MTTTENGQRAELARIKAQMAAATKGPWRGVRGGVFAGREQVAVNVHTYSDAEFIAQSPANMAKLITALEAVQSLADNTSRFVSCRGGASDGYVMASDITEAISEALA